MINVMVYLGFEQTALQELVEIMPSFELDLNMLFVNEYSYLNKSKITFVIVMAVNLDGLSKFPFR